jgi:hypothetical protein
VIAMQATESKEQTTQQASGMPECPFETKPQAQHEWLHRMVGEWEGTCEAHMGPDRPDATWKSREVVRSIGGLWVVAEGTGPTPNGGTATTIATLGFDPQKGRYVGTFIASMMNHMWVYDGSVEPNGNVLTLDTEGPGMTPDVPRAKYKDVVEFLSNDERTLTSYMLGPDGHWSQVMKANYKRIW